MIKFNLGCGHRILPQSEGWVNIDLPSNWSKKKPDVECDISKGLPFPDDYADEVHAYHVFEHFYRWQIDDILSEWIRVLKPGGLLILEMPCLDKVLALFMHFLKRGEPADPSLTVWAFYGDPRYESVEMTHKWIYSKHEIGAIMANHELADVNTDEEPKTHVAIRDMRVVAMKPRRILTL